MAKLNGQVTGSALESSRVRIDVLGCALSGSTSTAFNSRVTHSLGHSASHNPRRQPFVILHTRQEPCGAV